MSKAIPSLRAALLMYIVSGLMIVLILAGTLIFLVARSSLRAQADDALVGRAETFASLVTQDRGGLDFDYEGPIGADELGLTLRITDEDDEIVVVSPDWPGMEDYEADDEAEEEEEEEDEDDEPNGQGPGIQRLTEMPWHESDVRDATDPDGAPARMVTLVRSANWDIEELGPLPAGQRPRTITVEIIGNVTAARRAESALLTALIAGGALAAGGTALAVWIGIGRGLAPIRRLRNELDGIDSGHLSGAPDPGAYPKELRPMVTALDAMLQRVRIAVEREQRFTDAAAHELRTPIAELRTITDVARRWPDEQRLRKSVEAAGDVADEIETLLDTLLCAARGTDVGEHADSDVPLMPLIRAVASANAGRLSDRQIKCEIDGDEDASWTGPKGAILAIIRNLIENAGEYTPEGGSVRIRTANTTDGASLEVENGPIEMPTQQVDQLFEPFWRADAARADRNHRGLGLAIVDGLATSLGLSRDASVTREGWLRICIRA